MGGGAREERKGQLGIGFAGLGDSYRANEEGQPPHLVMADVASSDGAPYSDEEDRKRSVSAGQCFGLGWAGSGSLPFFYLDFFSSPFSQPQGFKEKERRGAGKVYEDSKICFKHF
jgi:hypothetical protein